MSRKGVFIIEYSKLTLNIKKEDVKNFLINSFKKLNIKIIEYKEAEIINIGYFYFISENEKNIDELFKSLYVGFGVSDGNNPLFRIDYLS